MAKAVALIINISQRAGVCVSEFRMSFAAFLPTLNYYKPRRYYAHL